MSVERSQPDVRGVSAADAERLAGLEQRLLGRPASMGRREVSAQAGVSLPEARRFWHSLGFQIVDDEDAMFTEADLEALREVTRLIREGGVDSALALDMTRAFARTADRLSVWQTQLVAESLMAHRATTCADGEPARVVDRDVAEDAAELLVSLADDIEPLLTYVWRRHLTSAISRMLADARSSEEHDASAPPRVVGFADLVSFTALVRRMSERELGVLVQRFEQLASDVVTSHGGRIIKTVGDEVLFVHADPAAAAGIALDLVDAMAEDDVLPQVRVGMAQGKVVSRLGDVFGTTVNRASRLTSVTPPGTVLVDEGLASRLGAVSGFRTTPGRRRTLRGIGSVTPSVLHRADSARRLPAWESLE